MRRPAIDTAEAPVVLVTFPDYDEAHPEIGGALTNAGYSMRIAAKRGARSPSQLLALCDGASAAIASTDPFTRDVLRDSPALRVIARVGVGTDSIDVAAATELGVAVTTTPGANETTVADHAIALMLALLRRIVENDGRLRGGQWNRTGVHTPRQLAGLTVGLVGFGHIGGHVARRLEGFDVTLLVADPVLSSTHSPPPIDLVELLARSDVVSLHCPLNASTHHLIDDAALHLMKRDALLINTSRGEVVDQHALIHALQTGLIGGATLDVFEVEPPGESPLMKMANVVVSPHVGGISTASLVEMTRRATRSVIDVLTGNVPDGLANPAILD